MAKFFYIQAVVRHDGGQPDDEDIRFYHHIIEAVDHAEAHRLGRSYPTYIIPDLEVMNDYVVEVPHD